MTMEYVLAWVYLSGVLSTVLMHAKLHPECYMLTHLIVGLIHPVFWSTFVIALCVVSLVPDSVKRRLGRLSNNS